MYEICGKLKFQQHMKKNYTGNDGKYGKTGRC